MNTIAAKLEMMVEKYLSQLNALSDDEFIYKPSPEKWSKKEIIGHLIDSAQNNIRRFIVAQYELNPAIAYNQDEWVAINDYQHQSLEQLIQLWYLINKQIVTVLKNTSNEMAQRTCDAGQIQTIEWLASDYIKHLTHHLHQVLNLKPVAYP
ncbi:MAG: DinB family protein [Ginsengibacter sp.]